MHRSKSDILKAMDPAKPETIQALIDFHRRAAGGFVMVDDPDPKPDPKPDDKPDEDPKPDDKKDGDEALGAAGLKALRDERDARKALETQLADLKSKQIDPKKLAEALGLKVEGATSSSEDIVTALQERIDGMEKKTSLYRIAAKHSITDQDDLDLLGSLADEAAMEKLAGRLAKKPAEPEVDPKTGKPKVDKSQGRGGEGDKRPSSVQQVMEERRAAREKTTTK